ncbi:PEP-CTERM sorting domain-containing protein [Armatimonas sp.]
MTAIQAVGANIRYTEFPNPGALGLLALGLLGETLARHRR